MDVLLPPYGGREVVAKQHSGPKSQPQRAAAAGRA